MFNEYTKARPTCCIIPDKLVQGISKWINTSPTGHKNKYNLFVIVKLLENYFILPIPWTNYLLFHGTGFLITSSIYLYCEFPELTRLIYLDWDCDHNGSLKQAVNSIYSFLIDILKYRSHCKIFWTKVFNYDFANVVMGNFVKW